MFRKITSLTILFSSILIVATGIVLYMGPPTHIAFFSDWRMLGLTKNQWNAMHVTNGILFLIGLVVHVVYNWRPLLHYLKSKNHRVIIITLPCVISLCITVLVCIDAILFLPPAKQVFHLGHVINQNHIRRYGVFPFGPPDAYTLTKAAMYLGCNPEDCLAALRRNGINVDGTEQSVLDIAQDNGISMNAVLDIMRESGGGSPGTPSRKGKRRSDP